MPGSTWNVAPSTDGSGFTWNMAAEHGDTAVRPGDPGRTHAGQQCGRPTRGVGLGRLADHYQPTGCDEAERDRQGHRRRAEAPSDDGGDGRGGLERRSIGRLDADLVGDVEAPYE